MLDNDVNDNIHLSQYGDWELIQENIVHAGNKYECESRYRCRKCGNEKNIKNVIFNKTVNGKSKRCEKCEEIFIESLKDIKFGMLKIQSFSHVYDKKPTSYNNYYNCVCDCGKSKIVSLGNLLRGKVKSCGCLAQNQLKTHGMSSLRIYKIYHDMIKRCTNTKAQNYKYYGGKGIYVDDIWLDPENGFMNFYDWSMKNGYTDELSIDRKDPDGPYSPKNCRWITMNAQQQNKTSTHFVTGYDDIPLSAAQFSKFYNIEYYKVMDQLHKHNNDGKGIIDTFDLKAKVMSFDHITQFNLNQSITIYGFTAPLEEVSVAYDMDYNYILERIQKGDSIYSIIGDKKAKPFRFVNEEDNIDEQTEN